MRSSQNPPPSLRFVAVGMDDWAGHCSSHPCLNLRKVTHENLCLSSGIRPVDLPSCLSGNHVERSCSQGRPGAEFLAHIAVKPAVATRVFRCSRVSQWRALDSCWPGLSGWIPNGLLTDGAIWLGSCGSVASSTSTSGAISWTVVVVSPELLLAGGCAAVARGAPAGELSPGRPRKACVLRSVDAVCRPPCT